MQDKKIVKIETNKVLSPIGDRAIERGTELANKLKQIILQQKLYATINGKQFVTVEGWTTLGAMLGLFPVVEDVKCEKRNDHIIYIATVAIKNMNDQILGRAVGMCSSEEKTAGKPRWRDEYAIMSMAQTRATSKAFRLVASWIVALAGFETTPAEEMINIENNNEIHQQEIKRITPAQRRKLFVLMKQAIANAFALTDIPDSEVKFALNRIIDLKNAKREFASSTIDRLKQVIRGCDPNCKDEEAIKAKDNFISWYMSLENEAVKKESEVNDE